MTGRRKVFFSVYILEEEPLKHSTGIFVCTCESHTAHLFPFFIHSFIHMVSSVNDDAHIFLLFVRDDAIH